MINCSQKWSLIFASLILCQPIPIIELKASPRNTVQETTSTQQAPKELTPLELGKAIERELKGGETHSYSIELKTNDYLNLVVEQKGIDVVVSAFSPLGEKVYEIDASSGTDNSEFFHIVAQISGIYRLKISSIEKEAKLGKYEIKLIERREAIAIDTDRVSGFKALGEASILLKGDAPETEETLELILTKYHAAAEKLEKALELVPQANALYTLGYLYRNKGDYEKAESIHQKALDIRKKVLGDNHPLTATSLNDLARLYREKGEYEKAEMLYLEALEIRKKVLGNNHPDTAESLQQLAILLQEAKTSYEKVERFHQEALEIRKKVLGNNHPDTADSLNNLALFYSEFRGEYEKAESLFLQALEIRKKVLGENHLHTSATLNGLASLYDNKGEYEKAESLYLQDLNICKKVFGENHPSVAISLNDLARVYERKGEYEKAEPLYLQSLNIFKKTLGNEHPYTVTTLSNLAGLYDSKGDFEKAEKFNLEALEIRKKTLGIDHPSTANSILKLAQVYNNKQEYEKAEPLYLQALEIRRKVLNSNYPSIAGALISLGSLYIDKGEYEKAEPLCLEALELRKKALSNNHPDVANSLHHLARLYRKKGENEKAEPLYLETLDLRKKLLGDNHFSTVISLKHLASLFMTKGETQKSINLTIQTNDARETILSRNLTIGSERQKQLYLQQYARETDFTLSLHTQLATKDIKACQMALTQILRRKGRSIDAVNQSIEALRKRSKHEDIELLDSLTAKKRLFSNLTTQGLGKSTPEEYQKKLKTLQEEIEQLEYKVSERSAEFRTQSQPITLEAVQKAVAKDSTLIEFTSFQPYDAKENKYGTRKYVAYLLNSEGEPLWADLGEAEVIDKVVDKLRTKLKSKKTSIHREIKPLARRLDKLVMQPVRKLTGKGKRLLIAPDGKLNLVPFAALVDEKGKYLVESYPISYLTSGRDLLRLQVKIESKSNPVIIGNPDFGEVEAKNEKDSKVGASVFSELYFAPLKATEIEAKAIKQLLPSANLLMQKEANEQALTSLNAPSILHIATHGFFLTEEDLSTTQTTDKDQESSRIAKKEKSASSGEQTISSTKLENPLLRSGIALAGANLNQENNGIFTALKTTGLNLWGTKVVVLSACDTGVGEVKTGDGIYGLRRALVLAGSESQVMSLWPVSDNGTKDLMIAYYTKLEKGIGRSDALRQVQLELLKNPKRRHPFYWASFIQSGEWANLDGKR